MIRNAFTIVLVAVVVACPAMCGLNCCAGAGTSASAKKSCCSHCESREKHDQTACPNPAPQKNLPDRPAGMCCLCGGAIVDLSQPFLTDDLSPSQFLGPPVDAVAALVYVVDRRLEVANFDHHQPDSGRSLRIWIASLVI